MNITTYGDDPRLAVCKRCLERDGVLSEAGAVLLPIPSTRDGVTVTGCGVPLDAIDLPAGALLLGYGLPDSLVLRAREAGCVVADAEKEEEYLEEGAALTALGCLFRLSQTTGMAPASLRIGVVGYGRIGRNLVRLLLFLGAGVTVFTGREEVRLALGRSGVPTVLARYGEQTSVPPDVDVLVNTAPAKLFSPAAFPPERKITAFELASGDFLPAEADPIRLPALPAKVFPVSAGEIYAKAGVRALRETEAKK